MTQNEREIHYPVEAKQHPEPEEASGMKTLKRFQHTDRYQKAKFYVKVFPLED